MRKVLIYDKRRFYFNGTDLHTQFGFIKADEIEKAEPGSVLETNTGKKMHVFDASFIDLLDRIKRMPQIIPRKDVGAIIAHTGIGKESLVIDAGTGSGALACMLANIVKKVVSYELREDFLKVALKNVKHFGLTNITIKQGDVYEGIEEKNVDLVIFDLPEPWKAVLSAEKALKVGGFLVTYSPSIPQVMDLVKSLPKTFLYERTIEIIEREWEIDMRKVRPKSQQIGHSGFITFSRKIGGETK